VNNELTERTIANQKIIFRKWARLEMLARHAAGRGNSDRETQQFDFHWW